ncbi:MAG: NUDIX domain-containing protein [Tissierellaceae bacterium]|jgi:8-oxo-dGTP pyrophosphatase MutT (NUDIX family)|nr:NUDIX domain-containing protein [Tissierellaceae bacterium]
MSIEKSCGAIVFNYYNQELLFLIIKHKKELGGHWDFPKGHMEGSENEEETAKREVYEEVGLDIKLYKNFRKTVKYLIHNNIKKQVVYFAGSTKTRNVSILQREISGYKWLDYEKALNILTYESQKELLRKCYLFIKYNYDCLLN